MTHVQELRKRLLLVAASVVGGGILAYLVNEQLTRILLSPAGQQQFIYTTPGGGFDFLLRLCLYAGLLVAIPVMIYQLLRYLRPLMPHQAVRFIAWGTLASALLAAVGILFGYLVGLPAALQFLLADFAGGQIHALLSIQSYISFVMLYLLGSALLFQVPLVMLLINRIKPLNPKRLLTRQRWFVLVAFVLGAIINPSPNIQDQLLLTVPMIVMYQIGIGLVWLTNRRTKALAQEVGYGYNEQKEGENYAA